MFRPCQPQDEAAVVALFRSNLDPYFLPAEETELRSFLAQGEPCFVAEEAPGSAQAGCWRPAATH